MNQIDMSMQKWYIFLFGQWFDGKGAHIVIIMSKLAGLLWYYTNDLKCDTFVKYSSYQEGCMSCPGHIFPPPSVREI